MLACFCEVVEAGSLSEAAARLGVSQPTLSLQMRELEQRVGVCLLTRHSRGVVPTEAGKLLYARSCELKDFLARMIGDVRAAGGWHLQALGIGMTPSLMRLVGVDILVKSAERGDALPLRLVEALSVSLVTAVERKEIDIAFAYEVEDRPSLVRESVILDELLLVTSPGQTGASISFRDAIARELSFAGEQGIVSLVKRTADGLSLTPRIVSNVQSVSAIRSRIADGGASLLSYGTAADGVRRGFFAISRIHSPAVKRTLYIIRRRDNDPFRHDRRVAGIVTEMVRGIAAASRPFATIIDPRFAPEEIGAT